MLHIRLAHAADAPILSALSIETWLATYVGAGLGPVHADYVLREFSPDAMMRAIEDDHVAVLEQGGGLAGYCRARHGQDAPIAGCHGTELATLY
ncbi:MAG: GNAT family N-acetyltransferase, partial [Rhodobacteraceae bacterium]|nr:GNAT family N-acetyltransferase [Paracoccaceae bacterium]